MTYQWRKFKGVNQKYELSTESTNLISYPVNEISLDSNFGTLFSSFCNSFENLTIPNLNDNALNALVRYIGKEDKLESFRILGCALQQQFSNDYNEIWGKSGYDFSNHNKDFNSLLDFLEKYLNSKDKSGYSSILFKNDISNESLQNSFVIDEVYNAICQGFNLTKDNFKVKKEKILKRTNSFDLEKNAERFKWDFIKGLYVYLKRLIASENECLKLIGVFLHIFSIPYKLKPEVIDITADNETLMSLVDYQYIRNNLTRDRNFLK
ncbi:hypothetical protein [Cellulophaga lytica]|uniref:hypothetical protein n=1 Tax=Cellulophaga lytica TaxID=979 RepID=UPI000B5CB0C4|nr:hypothetical protein [Cellulophaga lytica]SNQ43832.1 hypothetical protein CL8139_390045 [Cellulophaga lytica]